VKHNVVSKGSLKAASLPQDSLTHDALARSILKNSLLLPPGAVVAVQGPWGRGKTDVLMRIQSNLQDGKVEGVVPRPLWINPWQYGTPDLLTPLVLELLELAPRQSRWDWNTVRRAAQSILRAGVNFGFKAVQLVLPGGKLMETAVGSAEELVNSLAEVAAEPPGDAAPDPDPVAVMGERFRELVEQVVLAQGAAGKRLVVCVDDLDRCLPDRQVAILEAVQFLVSANASVTFFVALDPVLVRQAVVTHYGTDVFDPDRYIDKMFDLRVNLPAVSRSDLGKLVRGHLDRPVTVGTGERPLHEVLTPFLGGKVGELEQVTPTALWPIDLRNPRIIRRIFDRLHLLARSDVPPAELHLQERDGMRLLLLWLGLIERWPDLRRTLQHAEDFAAMFNKIHELYVHDRPAELPESIRAAIPARDKFPDLIAIMKDLEGDRHQAGKAFSRFDKALIRAGL
jgi:hypothetical protein